MAKIVWETVLWLWAMYAFITSHIVFFLDQVKPHPHVQCVIIWKKKKKNSCLFEQVDVMTYDLTSQ